MTAATPPPALPDLPVRDPRLPRVAWLALAASVALALAVLVLAGQGEVPLAPASAPPLGVRGAEGASLMVSAGCTGCHDPGGRDSPLGPALDGVSARVAARLASPDYRGGPDTVEGYLEQAIVDHCADPLAGYDCSEVPDPGLLLTAAEVTRLVGYLMSLPEGSAP